MVEERNTKLTAAERERRNELLENMHESGELNELRQTLYARLILEDAWRDEMKESTRVAVNQAGGISEITMDELVHKLLPVAKRNLPGGMQSEMMQKIKNACNNS
mmetsp:Transcript_92457/g.266975  ORF Transcript_92457/g.266975 Transcript_92457/m.266975 type:complete len:105 (+) Transcript_92457:104-418(+)